MFKKPYSLYVLAMHLSGAIRPKSTKAMHAPLLGKGPQ